MSIPVRFSLAFLVILFSSCEGQQKQAAKASVVGLKSSQQDSIDTSAKMTNDSLQAFTWDDESCTNIGYFKAGAYTKQQLQATFNLVNFPDVLTTTTAFSINDYTASYFNNAGEKLNHEYDSIANSLKNTEVVPSAFWQKVKKLRSRELDENFQLAKFALEGYYRPISLTKNHYYPHCKEFADALASTDTVVVMQAWRKLVNIQKPDNGYPESLEERFLLESTSPERMSYAKMALMNFGWYNCANGQRKYGDLYDQYHLRQRYHKLFKTVKSKCEDVD